MKYQYQKKQILVPIGEPVFVRHEANHKHNEVTVAVVRYAIPLNSIFCVNSGIFDPNVLTVAFNAIRSFQGINFNFNRNSQAPAFTFIVKGKTERRGNDVPNQELADNIALAKANKTALAVVRVATKAVAAYYAEEVKTLTEVVESLNKYSAREMAFINKV